MKMHRQPLNISCLLLITAFSFFIQEEKLLAQNLEKVGKKDMLKVSGGINNNTILLNTNNPNSTRDPFSWYLNGNITVTALDWALPFNYSYSNQHSTYSQPFNQYGITPTYKWIKAYAGWSNMSFSQYTFSGYPFLGGGVELSPKSWKFALMYGRLKKAVEYDAINESDQAMSFKRMGVGAKAGYEKNGYALNLIWFHAKDDEKSLSLIPDATRVRPQENTVVSATAKAPITKLFNVEAEYALSGFSGNTFSEELPKGENNKLPVIFKPRATSEFFSAFKSSLNMNLKFMSCGFNYERVAPGYQTLGTYYMNNDLENITVSPQFRLFSSKLNVSLNAGVQRNNLNNNKLSTMKRVLSAGTIAFVPNAKWNFTTAYSNFTSYTRNRPVTDPFYITSPADTMKFYQIAQNGSATASHNFGSDKLKNVVTLMGMYMVSRQETGSLLSAPVKTLNGNLAYTLQFVPTKTMVSFCMNVNNTKAANMNSIYYGPGISFSKAFLSNALNCTAGSIYNLSSVNDKSSGGVFNERLSLAFSPKMKDKKMGSPSAGLSASYVYRKAMPVTGKSLSELTINVNLGYTF